MYQRILSRHAVPCLQTITNPVFMQDNAPCTRPKKVIAYLSRESTTVMDWPAQSPDLNPTENEKVLNLYQNNI